jgi:ribosomal protein S18 acetylase RimI-like enzyme
MNPERMHEPPVTILPAAPEDLRALVDIEEAVSMQKYPNAELGITPEDIIAIGWGEARVAKYRGRFLENPNANMWVAKENGQVVGYTAAVKNEDGHRIWKLYVANDKQGHGIGSKLLAQAEEWLGRNEPIWLGVASYDQAALDFYTKHGYEPAGLRPENQTTVHATGKVIHETLLVKQPA